MNVRADRQRGVSTLTLIRIPTATMEEPRTRAALQRSPEADRTSTEGDTERLPGNVSVETDVPLGPRWSLPPAPGTQP